MNVFCAKDAAPLGAIFGAIGATVTSAVSLLGLDRLPVTLCVFKALTGIPCPTCGGTRAIACLGHMDLGGAFTMNPLAAAGALAIGVWAAADVALLPTRRALAVELSPGTAQLARAAAVAALAANWIYLVAAGR